MKQPQHIVVYVLLALPVVAQCATWYVSPDGNDSNSGTTESVPFRTIQQAVDQCVAGDTVLIGGGIYRETVMFENRSGNDGAPIVLKAYEGGEPVISGLNVSALDWTTNSGIANVWVADYTNAPFEQLFVDDRPMLEAHWPDVPTNQDGSWNFFSPDMWAAVNTNGNSYGTIKDADLAATGWNITGSRVVLNVDHQFYCWSRVATNHTAGSDTFNYPTNLGSSVDAGDETGVFPAYNDDRYYLVGEMDYLDAPGEWVLDAVGQKLYFYPPDEKDPRTTRVEIKTRDYGLTADRNSGYITVDGITFFGTAFQFGERQDRKSTHILFRNNSVFYSSWTEYFNMPPSDVHFNQDRISPVIQADNCRIENNTFAYGALGGLLINGFDNQVENNVFHDFNGNSTLRNPPLEVGRSWDVYAGTGGRAVVCYNTIYNSGGICIQTGLQDNEVYKNDLYDFFLSCWGGNKDVSALYTISTNAAGTRFHHNWIHDGYAGAPPLSWGGGIGIRGDDNMAGLTVDHNVIWNLGSTGVLIKNPGNPLPEQANGCFNNTVFNHSGNNSVDSAIIIPSVSNSNNVYSSVVNNMADTIYGGWYAKPLGQLAAFSNNSTGITAETLLESPAWFDFRPAPSSSAADGGTVVTGITGSVVGAAPDIGAYEYGDMVYWIPGRRETKATFPVVPDGAMVSTNRDVLMWRPAYNADSHRLCFGTTQSNLICCGEYSGETNVFPLPDLSVGQEYFWRVDAVMPDASVVTGDVWRFIIPISSAYQTWAEFYGLGSHADDPDGDGADNFYEYGFGGNPTNSQDIGVPPFLNRSDDGFKYIYVRRTNDSVLSYLIETTDDLVNGVWSSGDSIAVGSEVFNSDLQLITHRIESANPKMFVRLRVETGK